MNKHDSERIAGLVEASGYVSSPIISEADLVVFYTCCVRKSADDRFYGQLGSIKYKEGAIIAVGGCLAQKESEKLLATKKVDIVFGTRNLKELPVLINNLNGQPLSNTSMLDGFNADLPTKRESEHKAWLAINQGCNNHCTYCIVPSVRGSEISRPMKAIIAEVESLVDDGVKEITLLGQNVNSYGKDTHETTKFAELLEKVSKSGIKRVRFTTSHPKDLSEDIIKAIKKLDNVCEHIHLPVQAGSSAVLKKMGRGYTKEKYLQLVDLIREHLPNAAITTDIMVGFPGESQEDFGETLDLAKKAAFDQAFTFIYSKREGTKAAAIQEQLPYETKLERFKQLVKLQDEISLAKNKPLINRIEEILVDEPTKKDKSMLSGRTKTNKLVHFKGNASLVGQFVNVKIIDAKPFFLIGKCEA